uniref:G protein-coupled receptor n=1 Tax=Caenorhabditis japonica TaxID=281687 RepID=A0A8R1HL00_CAEJA
MCYFGLKCYTSIKRMCQNGNAVYSVHFRSIQKQLFVALVSQTLIPLVLIYIPSCLIILTCVADASIPYSGTPLSMSIAIFPAIDPLPNMFLIADYRKTIIDYCRRILGKSDITNRSRLPSNQFSVGMRSCIVEQ